MLNVKYFISKNDNDEFEAYVNEDANGNAWFVENIYKVDSQNEAILSLDSLNLNKSVVSTKIRSQKFKILDNSTINLVEAAFEFAIKILEPGGCFVSKVFQGGTEEVLLTKIKKLFSEVKHSKPPSSRKESAELYVIAKNFRP